MIIKRIERYPKTEVIKVFLENPYYETVREYSYRTIKEGFFYTDMFMLDYLTSSDITLSLLRDCFNFGNLRVICSFYLKDSVHKRDRAFHYAMLTALYDLNASELTAFCKSNQIDHINGVSQDNTDKNLNKVTNCQNMRNRQSIGYSINDGLFKCSVQGSSIFSYKNEVDVCQAVYNLRKRYYTDYDYNFFLDRRDELDILDLERTGQISTEEAVYRHVLRHNNAWFYYRFNLAEYYRDNHITLPPYKIDDYGRLVNVTTNRLLCPEKSPCHSLFYTEGRVSQCPDLCF